MQIFVRSVIRTFLPLQKKVSPFWMQFCTLEEDNVWYDFELQIVMRLFLLTSGVIETFEEKLKWTGRGRNL
jgi:hypothetical protein